MASRIPSLPQHSHVQSHAAVHRNNLCDSRAAFVARQIARGWTRPLAARRERPLSAVILNVRSNCNSMPEIVQRSRNVCQYDASTMGIYTI